MSVGLVFAVEGLLHLVEQADALVELPGRDQRLQVLDAAVGVGDEHRLVLRPEEPGAVAAAADGDVVRHRAVRRSPSSFATIEPIDGVDDAALPFAVAGVHEVLGPRVGAFGRAHPADDDARVHHLGDLRQVLADLDAGCARLDRLELTGALAVGLEVEACPCGSGRRPSTGGCTTWPGPCRTSPRPLPSPAASRRARGKDAGRGQPEEVPAGLFLQAEGKHTSPVRGS